jgi:tetratricopeptide (TPR) repeat protein
MVETAMLFWHHGDYDGAIAGFDQVTEAYGFYPPAAVGKGRALLSLDKPKEAASYLKQALDAAPLTETAWLLCNAYTAAGDAENAKAACDRAEKEGLKTDARTLSLFYSVRNEKPEEAKKLAEQEMKDRAGIYTLDALAWALYRNGKFEEAKAASDKATKYGTRDARLMYHAGAIRLALKDAAGGRKWVQDALKENPEFDLVGAKEARALLGIKEGTKEGTKDAGAKK